MKSFFQRWKSRSWRAAGRTTDSTNWNCDNWWRKRAIGRNRRHVWLECESPSTKIRSFNSNVSIKTTWTIYAIEPNHRVKIHWSIRVPSMNTHSHPIEPIHLPSCQHQRRQRRAVPLPLSRRRPTPKRNRPSSPNRDQRQYIRRTPWTRCIGLFFSSPSSSPLKGRIPSAPIARPRSSVQKPIEVLPSVKIMPAARVKSAIRSRPVASARRTPQASEQPVLNTIMLHLDTHAPSDASKWSIYQNIQNKFSASLSPRVYRTFQRCAPVNWGGAIVCSAKNTKTRRLDIHLHRWQIYSFTLSLIFLFIVFAVLFYKNKCWLDDGEKEKEEKRSSLVNVKQW